MKKFEIALAASLMFGAGCAGTDAENPPATSPEPIESHKDITTPEDNLGQIEEGVLQYSKTYGCPVEVEITYEEIPSDDNNGENSLFSTAVSNKSGSIIVNSDLPPEYYKMVQRSQIIPARIGAHEATHACQENETPMADPLELPNQGLTFVAVRGLSLITDQKTPDGSDFTKFSALEEGAAQVIATSLYGKESSPSPYDFYEQLTLDLMENGNLSTEELVGYIQKNDIYGFLSHVSGIENPTNDDLLDLITLYSG